MEIWNFYQPDLIATYYEFEKANDEHHMYMRYEIYNMVYVFQGKITIATKDEVFDLSENDIFLLTPRKKAEIKTKSKKANILIFRIDPFLFKNTQDEHNVLRAFDIYNKKINANNLSSSLIAPLFASIRDCICNSKGRYHVVSRFTALICELALEYDKVKRIDNIPNSNITIRTIDYIEKHFTENLTLESVAKEIGISKNSVGRICRAMRGKSFLEFLNELRFQKAKTLLERENLNIKNIAVLCGFKSYNSFYKAYIKRFESMPSKKSIKIQGKSYWPFETANYAFEENLENKHQS